MLSVKEVKRHIRNIKLFRAYSTLELARQTFLFPFDYYFKNGRSSCPLHIALFVTQRCNARCTMCNLKEILNKKEKQEPTLDDIEKLLFGLKATKPSITLFGGEPFVRKDIVDIVKLVKKHGFSCGMFTNGILLNKDSVLRLSELSMDFIVFSIQGIGETHDKIVGIKGAYSQLINNMDLFIKHRKHTKIIVHIMISEDNLDDLVRLARVCRSKGVDLVRFGHPTFFTSSDIEKNRELTKKLFPGEEISEMSYAYNPEGKTEEYYNTVKKLKREFGSKIIFVPDLSLPEVKNWYSGDFKTKAKCLFLWRGLFIYPNGDVYPCESLRYPMGNVYKQDFKDIWNSDKYAKLRRIIKKGLLPACARCCKL